jgi:hypothetical protein
VERLREAAERMRAEMGDAKRGAYTVRWEMVAPLDAALAALTPEAARLADGAPALAAAVDELLNPTPLDEGCSCDVESEFVSADCAIHGDGDRAREAAADFARAALKAVNRGR